MNFTFFVNYDDFYVNAIMLTNETVTALTFIIFDDFARYGGKENGQKLNLVFASFPSQSCITGKFNLPSVFFVQLNDCGICGNEISSACRPKHESA